ncbi:MAG TPA: CTP synthetase, partial [Spirochaetota bacterium]|nr:CTP synthetase [Spirochaetota bacterium]
RYEVNPSYIKQLEKGGLVFSGKAPGEPIMQIMELPDHRFFMASQFHPELTSRLEKPSELFFQLIKATF